VIGADALHRRHRLDQGIAFTGGIVIVAAGHGGARGVGAILDRPFPIFVAVEADRARRHFQAGRSRRARAGRRCKRAFAKGHAAAQNRGKLEHPPAVERQGRRKVGHGGRFLGAGLRNRAAQRCRGMPARSTGVMQRQAFG
jgi:hypothetical protein